MYQVKGILVDGNKNMMNMIKAMFYSKKIPSMPPTLNRRKTYKTNWTLMVISNIGGQNYGILLGNLLQLLLKDSSNPYTLEIDNLFF